jgi:hypothetical protein
MKLINILQLFLKSILSILKVLILSRRTTKLPKNRNNTCVILGNGPSLLTSITNLETELDKADLICVNFFPIHDAFEQIKPRNFIACDSVFWEDTNQALIEKRNVLFTAIRNKVTWEFYLFMPKQAKKKGDWLGIIKQNENIKVIFYNTTPIEGLKSLSHFFFQFNFGMPRPHNVMIPAIFMGINMKYEKIYLVGAEHSWLKQISVDDNNNVFVGQEHFYNQSILKTKITNGRSGIKNLPDILYTLMTTFRSYHILNDYADRRGTKIYNCTNSSFIDAFERMNIN